MTKSQRFLEQMIVSTIYARELEQNRVSRVLHDDVGQVLSAVGLMLEALKLDHQQNAPELRDRLGEIQQMLEAAVKQVRAISYDLNPSVVERAGLERALDRLIARHRDRFSGTLEYSYDPSVRVPHIVGNAWYKIADLALENAVRHSSASRIEVLVDEKRNGAVIEIRDNGIGFSTREVKRNPKGLGLLLISHYGSKASIKVDVKSTVGAGSTVRSTYQGSASELVS